MCQKYKPQHPHHVKVSPRGLGDTEKFPRALGFKSLDPLFFRVSQQGPRFIAVEEDGGEKRLVELEPA